MITDEGLLPLVNLTAINVGAKCVITKIGLMQVPKLASVTMK
jgi:hypothetical protein